MSRTVFYGYATSGHQRSSQYSANNAWNVNNNGNVNNNNKYNGLTAIPLSELIFGDSKMEGRYHIPLGHIWDAYYECIRNKTRTQNAMMFGIDLERNITRLWRDINNRTYTIGRSICFIVEHPVKREVFAADFRDRVVHDYICMRLIPLIEERLPDGICSNRKGKGTLYAINRVAESIRRVSHDYTRDCWIWKFDLKGFFMSIDKRLLNEKVQNLIDEAYTGRDKDTLKWLTEMVIMNCPQLNCIRKSKPCAWDGLRADKSLFSQDPWHGVPIGNLPSQILANFLLMMAVLHIIARGLKEETQYVDDGTVVHDVLEDILEFIPEFRIWLKVNLGIELHTSKTYLQHYTKGVSFVGAIIKPHRIYPSKRMRRKMLGKIHWMTHGGVATPQEALPTVNSYLGLTHHFAGYRLRERVAGDLFQRFGSAISFNEGYHKMIIHKKYEQ